MKTGSKKKKQWSGFPHTASPLSDLPAWDSSTGLLHVVVDTPKGSRIKFKYEGEKRSYVPSYFFPAGTFFPFDFGSIPSTFAQDGDPLDVLVLMEEPSFTGCLVSVRPIGVLEAEQTQDGKANRNDRILGVADASRVYREVRSLDDVPGRLLKEIERFFVFYNEDRGRRFEVIGRFGPDRASLLVAAGERRFRQRVHPRRKRSTT